jgi:hypothetical protein
MAEVDVEPAPQASGMGNAGAAFDTKGGKRKFAANAINSVLGKKAVVRSGTEAFYGTFVQPVSLSCCFCDNGSYA